MITLEKETPAKASGRESTEGWWDRVVLTDESLETIYCDREPFMLGEMDDLKHEVQPHRPRAGWPAPEATTCILPRAPSALLRASLALRRSAPLVWCRA